MKKVVALLEGGFESSSNKTPEFKEFAKVFKKEFKDELKTVGAKNIEFSVGHFYICGFFTALNGQVIYFSTPDVRGVNWCLLSNPQSCLCQLLYRKAKSYTDYSGESNLYTKIRFDMITDMARNF